MIRSTSVRQLSLPHFDLPFGGELDPQNRWVQWADHLPWEGLEQAYHATISSNMGRPSKPARMVLGALIIKHKLRLADEETVRQIQENPYLQYFIGLHSFSSEPVFVPSLFVEFRKRLGEECFDAMDQVVINAMNGLEQKRACRQHQDANGSSPSKGDHTADAIVPLRSEMKEEETALPEDHQITPLPLGDNAEALLHRSSSSTSPEKGQQKRPIDTTETAVETTISTSHRGKLIMDATVADQAIRFPTDLSLLNEARVSTEKIVDALYAKLPSDEKKPRTYRYQARNAFLAVTKCKRAGGKKMRSAIRKQLNYIRRNLGSIDRMLDALITEESPSFPIAWKLQHRLFVVQTAYTQQREMYENRCHRCDHRIVSISQPHVRPIVRGKAGRPVEFGSKLSVSLVNGLAFVDEMRWDAFNESQDLIGQVERYKQRFGFYPEVVLADNIYGTRANRAWLKAHGIRYGGKALGRPRKETERNGEELKALKKQHKQDALDRIPVEGKFGQGKGGYGLNYIRARLASTSEAWVRTIFLMMNLMVLITVFLRQISSVYSRWTLYIVCETGCIALFRQLYRGWRVALSKFEGCRYFISGARHAC